MASLKKEILPSGTTRWRARYTHAGRQHEKAFRLKSEGERWLAERTVAIATGSHTDPARGRISIKELAEIWFESQVQIKPKTKDNYRQVLDAYVLPRWGRVRLDEVEHGEVSRWVASLHAGTPSRPALSASSVRHAHRVLALLIGHAVKDRRIGHNPAEGVPLPRLNRPAPRFLTRRELAALADAAGDDRDLVLTLAHTGLRFGELTGLRVMDLDPVRRRLHVAQNVTELRGKHLTGTPKTHKLRWVPLPAFLVDDLVARASTRAPGEPLFLAPRGGRVRITNWRNRTFMPACRAAGLTNFKIHDLRHTAASLAVSAGANVKMVQRMLGHASAAMTLDVYAALFEDDLDALGDRLDRAHRESEEPNEDAEDESSE